DRVLLAPRCQPPAVRAEGHVHTSPRDPCVKRVARFLLLVEALRVPEFHDPVEARRSEVLAIATKHQSADSPFVGIERTDLLAGLSIPYLHGSIDSTRYQVAAVGAERHAAVPGPHHGRELEGRSCRSRVPDSNSVFAARRGDAMAFGMPGQTEDSSLVAARLEVVAELGAHRAGPRVPDLHNALEVGGRSNAQAVRDVGADRHTADFTAVLGEGQSFLA